MSQSEIPNIDELLNSFLDGELDASHQAEVQRLLKDDKQIAERLLKLQQCKRLVSSLPYTDAPQELLGNIKASLEEKNLLVSAVRQDYAEGEQLALRSQQRREREGVRHLLVRRLTAAAAMTALAAVFALVIYSIVVPEVTIPMPPVETFLADVEFSSRLELTTSSPSEVVTFINNAIEDNIPLDERPRAVSVELGKSNVLICSRQNLKLLMADLGSIWNKLDSARLFIDTDQPEEQIVIDAVAADQIIEIVSQDDFETRIKAARYFAALNNVTPGTETMLAEDSSPDSITIPKPVLTSNEKPTTKDAGETEAEQKVLLTIIVTGSE